MPLRILLVLLVALVLPGFARAQTVRWDPPRGTLPMGQATGLALVFEGCSPKGQPTLPKVEGLGLQFYGQSESTSIINMSVSHSVTLTYAALLSKKQSVEIPSFEVETDKGKIRVTAARFEPTNATVGTSGTPLDSAATAKLTVSPSSVWAGEVFDLTTTVAAARSYAPQFQRNFDWTSDPVLAESWSNPEQLDTTVGGEPYNGITFHTRAIARTSGSLKLNPASHVVGLSVGVSGFGFFQQRQYDSYSVVSNTPMIEVKALPTPPAGFGGAVGQFKLTSKVVPATAAVGEPITWTLELSGTGNWPDIAGLPARDVSKDFNVVQPQAKRSPAEGKIFDVTLTEDVVLVPTKAGSYTLGPVNFVYFDSKSGAYKTITTPRATVNVTAPAAPKFNLTLSPTPETNPDGTSAEKTAAPAPTLSATPPPVPTTPSGIPRDPIPGTKTADIPLNSRALATALLLPFGALALFWFGLAVRRAAQTDPVRPRREARARLAATLARLRTAGPAQQPGLLIAWKRDSAVLWEISHAAPAPAAFNDAVWSTLWKESDRALYATDVTLPADWIARAEKALAAKRVAGFSPLRLFLPRNLTPFLFTLMLALLMLPATARAQDPTEAYRSGEFSAAEKVWREVVTKQPTNWIARHNLALALAQQDRWGESAAHASVAFVQHPNDPAVRWHFALADEKANFAPAPLVAFLQPTPARNFAMRTSPAEWQRVLIGAAGGIALALGVLLFNAYRRRSRAIGWSAFTLFLLCGGLAGLAAFGISAYGIAADTRAVITWRGGTLRSIPTEADTSQKTSPLPAGSVALTGNDFLGWTQLVFENGQTGWVRDEEIIAFWR